MLLSWSKYLQGAFTGPPWDYKSLSCYESGSCLRWVHTREVASWLWCSGIILFIYSLRTMLLVSKNTWNDSVKCSQAETQIPHTSYQTRWASFCESPQTAGQIVFKNLLKVISQIKWTLMKTNTLQCVPAMLCACCPSVWTAFNLANDLSPLNGQTHFIFCVQWLVSEKNMVRWRWKFCSSGAKQWPHGF